MKSRPWDRGKWPCASASVASSTGAPRNYHPIDTRCHFLPPHAGLLEAMAEDLEVANALATPIPLLARDGNTYTLTPDLLAFSGQGPALAAPPHAFIVNTLNAHPVLGTVGLLHSHRAVFPLTFGSPDDTDDWSLCDWCDQCHRKGGLSVWVDAFEPAGGILGCEALVAALLGKVDAVEVAPGPRTQPLLPWVYRLWDAGFLLPLVGASGKDSNRVALGSTRTYVHIDGDVLPNGWVEAIRSGHTFATSGPLLDFQVNDCRPGATVADDGAVHVVARAASVTPFERLELVCRGETIATAEPEMNRDTGTWSAAIDQDFTPAESCWIAARCIGKAGGFAHTSPVRIHIQGLSLSQRPDAAAALVNLVRQTREWAETHGRYTNVKRRDQLFARCDEAMEVLERSV